MFGGIIIDKGNGIKLITLQQGHLQLSTRRTSTVDQHLGSSQTGGIEQRPEKQPHTTDQQHQKGEIDNRNRSRQEDIEVKRRDNKEAG